MNSSRRLLFLVLSTATVVTGCGDSPPPTTISSRDVVAKADLEGDWLIVDKAVAADEAGSRRALVGDLATTPLLTGSPALVQIEWQIDEDELRGVANGEVVATIPIVEHFDANVEEDGTFTESDLDRPFDERDFLRLDLESMEVAAHHGLTRLAPALFGDRDPEPTGPTPPPSWGTEPLTFVTHMCAADAESCDVARTTWSDAVEAGALFAFGAIVRRGWECDDGSCAGGEVWSRVTFLRDARSATPVELAAEHERARYLTAGGRLVHADLESRPMVWHVERSVPDHLLRPIFEAAAMWNAAWAEGARAAAGEALPSYDPIPCQRTDPDAACYCVPDGDGEARSTCAGGYDPLADPASVTGVTDPIRCHIEGAPADDLASEDFDAWSTTRMVGDECHLRVQTIDCSDPASCVAPGEAAVATIGAAPGDLLVATRLGSDPDTGEVLTGHVAIGVSAIEREAALTLATGDAADTVPTSSAWRSGSADDFVMLRTAATLLENASERADALAGRMGDLSSLGPARLATFEDAGLAGSLVTDEATVFATDGTDPIAGSLFGRDLGSEFAERRAEQVAAAEAMVQPMGAPSPWDPTLFVAAESLSPTGMKVLAERRILRHAMLQAFGHSLGLAHNPAASTDRANYGDDYYAITEAHPLPTADDFDAERVPEGDFGDWLTREERADFEAAFADAIAARERAGVRQAMTVSVMDLPHARGWPVVGVGRYDRMAVALAHHRLVDGYVTASLPAGEEPTPANSERELVPADGIEESGSHTEVPYAVCGIADLAAGADPRCIAHDLGESFRDIVRNQAWLRTMSLAAGANRLGRAELDLSTHRAQLARLVEPALHVARTIFGRLRGGADRTDAAPFGLVEQLYAAGDLLNLLARLTLPDPAQSYGYPADDAAPRDPYLDWFVPSDMGDLVFAGPGRPMASAFVDDGSGNARLERIGRIHDALFALEVVASRSVDQGKADPYGTNFVDLLPQSVDRLFDGLVRRDPRAVGYEVSCTTWPGSFPTCTEPSLLAPDLFEQGCYGALPDVSCRPTRDRGLTLGWAPSGLARWASLIALTSLPAADDPATDQRPYLCTEGHDDCPSPSAALVEGVDYFRHTSRSLDRQFLAFADSSARSLFNEATGAALVRTAAEVAFVGRMFRRYRGDHLAGDPPPDLSYLTPEQQARLGALGATIPTGATALDAEILRLEAHLDELETALLRMSWMNERAGVVLGGSE